MPINEVTREWYGKKATPQQRSAFDEVMQRMAKERQTKEEADRVLKEWVAEQRNKFTAKKLEEEKRHIEVYVQEQVEILTGILNQERQQHP